MFRAIFVNILYLVCVISLRMTLMKFNHFEGVVYSMQCKVYRFLLILPAFFMAGCTSDYAMREGGDYVVGQQVANIEDEPITRLSFVAASNEYDEIKIVVHQDGRALNDIVPASGDDDIEQKNSN